MKHKHADLIHAWADGAEIQYRAVPGHGEWLDAPYHMIWEWAAEYRIKPEEKKPVVRWLWAYKTIEGDWTHSICYWSDEEVTETEYDFKLEWSRTEFPE